MKKPFLGILLTALALGTGGLVLERLAIPALAAQDSSTPVVRSEQDSPSVPYGGAWSASSHSSFSGGDAVLSMDAGALATFTFTGSEVRWIGTRDEWSGIARVYIDGALLATVDTAALPTQSKTQAVLYDASGLPAATHTLTIEVTGTHGLLSLGSWIWIDAFDVFPRFEQDNPSVSYSGAWYRSGDSPSFSGGNSALATDEGARAIFTFTGTAVRWFGTRDEWSGMARVFLDGSLQAVVDGYASPGQTQALLYAAGGLAAVEHTLIIEVTGTHNPAANESWVWVDAFDLEAGGPEPAPTPTPPPPPSSKSRIEETEPSVIYAGSWISQSRSDLSGGSAVESVETNATASLTFNGTGVSWIGFKADFGGIAQVYLDGTLEATVDTYAPTEESQAVR